MTETTRLKLSLLSAAQSQKHVTVNEALTILDLFAGIINVASRASSSPPGSPTNGDIYILSGAGSGGWAGFAATDLALYIDGAWRRVLAASNMVADIADESHLLVYFDGAAWSGLPLGAFAGQLAFPAVQNPSAGVNVLDDYEEGTWTPALTFGGNNVGITYGASTLGRYTKVGNLVTINGMLTLTSKGSSTGAAQINGLPFTSRNDSMFGSCAIGYAGGFSAVTGAVLGLVPANGTKISVYQSANGAGVGLSNSQFTNTSAVYFAATYMAA